MAGSVFRHEMSPWFWEHYSITQAQYGHPAALLETCSYILFYASGFVVPFLILSRIVSEWRDTKRHSEVSLIDPHSIQTSIILLSFGCFLSFVLFLDGEVAFFQHLHTDGWNAWLLIFVSGASLFSVFAGSSGIRSEIGKTSISISAVADIACQCPTCGCRYIFPSKHLETYNIVLDK